MSLNKFRRLVLLIILALFILQYFGLNALAGSLTGSVAIWLVSLIDVFAFLETTLASRDIALESLYAVITIFIIYLIIGRAFCGWVCPMDFLFETVSKLRSRFINLTKPKSLDTENRRKQIGYVVVILFLVSSVIIEIPVFTNYLSHLTNFFRALNALVFASLSVPFDVSVLIYSLVVLFLLLIIEVAYPRLWCKSLCPLGIIYGVLNRVSLLKLSVSKDTCINCEACDKVCYMDVRISANTKQASIRDTNCILCGRCVDACKNKAKTLSLTFKKS